MVRQEEQQMTRNGRWMSKFAFCAHPFPRVLTGQDGANGQIEALSCACLAVGWHIERV